MGIVELAFNDEFKDLVKDSRSYVQTKSLCSNSDFIFITLASWISLNLLLKYEYKRFGDQSLVENHKT